MAKILHRGDCSDGYMRGEGNFRIIQDTPELQQQLITIEECGRICYRSDEGGSTRAGRAKFIRSLIKRGHHSVIEHSSLTVIFENVSRGFTHEMVRHRLCAFSQESTRYCDYAGGKLDLEEAELAVIVPPHIDIKSIDIGHNAEILMNQNQLADTVEHRYKKLRKDGWKPQDARQFLPIGIAAKIAVTANFREWQHIFAMRTQKAAHWEIRYVMCDLLAKLKEIIPVIFEDFEFSESPDANGYRYTLQEK